MSVEKQPVTLDRIVVQGQVEELRKAVEVAKLVLEGLKKTLEDQLESLKERVIRLEVNASVTETGFSVIANALELHGILTSGEATVPGAKTGQSQKEPTATMKEETTTRHIRLPFDPNHIAWTAKVGSKGPFEMSSDYNNPDHKALLSFLKEHAGGSVASGGFFYWIFMDAKSIGRKPSNQVRRLR